MTFHKIILYLQNNINFLYMTKFLKIKDELFLIRQEIEKREIQTKTIISSTHHIFVVDCSGSMGDELPRIRKDLYNKIATDLNPEDSLTIIWFSGRGQCGVILEDYHIHSGISLNKVKELIDRYLKTVGLTAFKDPFVEVKRVVESVSKSRPDVVHSLFFITDGYDNQYSTNEILGAVKSVKEQLSNSIIVEYGWYCNKELLSKMACEIGGVHIFSEHFQDYEPYIQKEFNNQKVSKRKYVELVTELNHGNPFNITEDGEVINYSVNDKNEVFLNESDECFYYFSKYSFGEKIELDMLNESGRIKGGVLTHLEHDEIFTALYASLFSFSRINDYDKVSEVLKFLGDAKLIIKKANTFGTQKINELEADFLLAVKERLERFTEGYNPNLEPAEDAYCVLDMIEDLMDNDDNLWHPNHDAFKYKRIGAKVVAKSGMTNKDKEEMEKLLKEGKVTELKEKVDEVSLKKDGLIFKYDNEDGGYPIANLVWNEKRANLSVQVNYSGSVELPENSFSKLPKVFNTSKFRNYTLIKDGVVHTYKLPVSLSEDTFIKLQNNGLLKGEIFENNKIYILDFSAIPVINRSMVKTMSAEQLFRNEYELLKLKASNTVFNHYRKAKIGKISFDFIEQFGEDATSWLKEFGITSSGFNPPSTLEKTGEEIFVNSLKVKIEKLTLMTAEKDFQKVLEKYKNGEVLTPREALLKPAIEEFETFMKSMKDLENDKLIESWIDKKSKLFKKRKNQLMNEISKSKFLCVVGKSWFKEFKSRDEKEMTINIDGVDIKFELDDKMEKIVL